jgi:hypothetical protein
MEGERIMGVVNGSVGKDWVKAERMRASLKKAKGDIVKEFEKMSPTDRAFDRVVKDMHDIFDQLTAELDELMN